MTTATQSPSAAALIATARLDNHVYRRTALIEELMSAMEELHRSNGQGESMETRLRAQRKHLSPILARLIVHLERQ